MKTQTRRFSAVLSCIALVITLVSVPSSSQGQGVNSISSSVGLGPATATSGFVSDVTYALLHGMSAYGTWQSVPNGSSMNVTNIFSTSSGGFAIYHTLAVTSSVPFTLASIHSSQTSPFFNFSGTMGADGITYTMFGIGIASDGTTYTTGNANTSVNAVYVIGYSYSIDITGSTMQQAVNTWTPLTPFSEQDTYTVNGSSAGSLVNFASPVPEPSTFTLAGIGGLAILLAQQRKNRSK
jgi:hypothetical protein